ncbi:MAG: M23 family metallopeptidase [Candidatus Paceibacterota bacterium]
MGWITQGFGGNGKWYQNKGIEIDGHNGLDFAGCDGYNVRAAHDGLVMFAGVDNFNGVAVEIITHEACDIGGKVAYGKTIYGHMRQGSLRVTSGQLVKSGDRIGIVGSTGLSTGPHLHFGLKRVVPGLGGSAWITQNHENGYLGAIDPLPFLLPYNASDAVKVTTIMETIIRAAKSAVDKLKELVANKKYA